MQKRSIIIPVYNQCHFTKQCLLDLFHLDQNNEIIVVNNGSTDNTLNVIKEVERAEHLCSFRLINNDKNLGFAKACNIGFVNSSNDIVIFLNNDIRISKSRLSNWVNDLLIEEDVLYSPTGGYLDKDYNFRYETNGLKEWNYLSGWLLAGHRNTFNKLAKDLNQEGCFIEDFGTYFEDTYMSFRAKEIGIQLKLIKVSIQHIGRGTSSRMNLSDIYKNAKQKFIKRMK